MAMESKKLSRSHSLAAKVVFAAFKALQEAGGQLPGRDVISKVEKTIDFDNWAKERYEKTGYIRWQSLLHFFTIDSIKAGFLVKKKGVWYLTPEGEAAIKLGELGLFYKANQAYREWAAKNKIEKAEKAEDPEIADEATQDIVIDEIEQKAMESLKDHIRKKNPYEFQDMVAALLRAMGYFTPFVAPRGKDGGVDVIAYQDPLGTKIPRIKVQVKHKSDTTSGPGEIRQLLGILSKDGDVGMFVSTGGFSADAISTARGSHIHVELIDFDRFIGLWQEFYSKIPDEDKAHLPLKPVYFLADED